jgi:hypothetical protein
MIASNKTMETSSYSYINTHARQLGQSGTEDDEMPPYQYMDDGKLSGIQYPGQHDVLSGRGGHAMAHSGNLKFRTLVDSYRPLFQQASSKRVRMDIANGVLAIWRGQNPIGRFLTKTEPLKDDSPWEDIGNRAALKKISQALRERRGYPMVAACQPGYHQNLQYSSMVLAAERTQAQPEDQMAQIKKIEEEIERLKQENAEQYKIQQYLLANQAQAQAPTQNHPTTGSISPQLTFSQPTHPIPPPPPASPEEADAVELAMKIDPDSHQSFKGTTTSTPIEQHLQFSALSPPNTEVSKPPLIPRPARMENRDKINSLTQVFDLGKGTDGSHSPDVDMGTSSDETTQKLMNEDLGSFSAGSTASPPMDGANHHHVRLNSNHSSSV